jgi:hypothetical protein
MTNDSLALGIVVIGVGLLLVLWVFRSHPIKKQQGFKSKLATLFSDGLEGPDQSMRVFLTGACALFIGSTMAISSIAPRATIVAFFVGWVGLLVLMLVALYCKYDLPRKRAAKAIYPKKGR